MELYRLARRGIATLYLVTEHTGFYERYGWDFLGMTQEDGTGLPLRLYGRTEPEGGAPWHST